MDSKQDRTPPVLRELVLNDLHYAVSSYSFLSLNAYCWNYSAWQLSCLKICIRYYMGLGKEWALRSEGKKVFSWGNATSSMWSFCQVYLYIYRSALAFSRTLYSVEQSFFCHKVHYPLQSQNLLILTRNTVKLFQEKIAMLGPHPTNLMQWRQAIGTVELHRNWVPSSYQISLNTSGDACPAVNQPLCKRGKDSQERIAWANVCWKKSSIVWACDNITGEKIIRWFILFFTALV